jgi:hypothetical protein
LDHAAHLHSDEKKMEMKGTLYIADLESLAGGGG